MNTKNDLNRLSELIQNLENNIRDFLTAKNDIINYELSIKPLLNYLNDNTLSLKDIKRIFRIIERLISTEYTSKYPITLNDTIYAIENFLNDNKSEVITLNDKDYSVLDIYAFNEELKLLNFLLEVPILDLLDFTIFEFYTNMNRIQYLNFIKILKEKIFKPLNVNGYLIKTELIENEYIYYLRFKKSVLGIDLFNRIEKKFTEFIPILNEAINLYFS